MLPLDGIRILDVGTMTPGKYCTWRLAGLGAQVVRIERPGPGGRGISEEDQVLNQGKQSMTLNLRHEKGRAIFLRLAASADVIVEGQRPGTADRHSYGYEAVRTVNEDIVYCALSGYGANGPLRQAPGYDLIFMGVSGMLRALSGGKAVPDNPQTYLADGIAGLSAAQAITTALLHRERTGTGAFIDLSMLDSLFSLLAVSHGVKRDDGDGPPAESPFYTVYPAAGESALVLGAVRASSQEALLQHLGRPALLKTGSRKEIHRFLLETFATRPAGDWVRELAALDIEIGVVNAPEDAFDHPQLRHRGMIGSVLDARSGVFQSIQPTSHGHDPHDTPVLTPAPAIGENTAALLADLGITEHDALREQGIV